MSMLLSEILLSRKPRPRPSDYGANSFYNWAVLNSYTLLKRTKEGVFCELVCAGFRQCKCMQAAKCWWKSPAMPVLLDLLSWLINKSRSRRGSRAFCAEQGNAETESPQSLEKMTVVCVFSHWKGGGGGCGSPKHYMLYLQLSFMYTFICIQPVFITLLVLLQIPEM